MEVEREHENWRRIKVMNFVMEAHAGQREKGGQDYTLGHLLPVAQSVPDHLFVPALAHDILEDTSTTIDDLKASGLFDDVEIAIIIALTKEKGVAYHDYIRRIRYVEDIVTIKLADIRHNLRLDRLARLDKATRERLRSKYHKALLLLYHLEE